MADLPPRFTADLEDTLNIPHAPADQASGTGSSSSVGSAASGSTPRRWDDPPEDEASAPPPENTTTMVFVRTCIVSSLHGPEIAHLTYTPTDTHLAAIVHTVGNAGFNPQGPYTVAVWSARTGARLARLHVSSVHALNVNGGFAFKPGVADMIVACPFLYPFARPESYDHRSGCLPPRLEVYDLGRRERLAKAEVPVRAPVAWSPDGTTLAAVSVREPSRVVVLRLVAAASASASGGGKGAGKDATTRVEVGPVLMGHVDEVTQLAFVPQWAADGRLVQGALVSAGRDGFVRVTDVASGRTLKKIEVGGRAAPGILRVSPDGRLVVTVWGRDVVVWWLDSGRVHSYSLHSVRQHEGWPLCVSPDCRYLICRTEDGFDVSDVETGKFRGELAIRGQPITSAAVNSDGTRLAVGDYKGGLQMFEILTP